MMLKTGKIVTGKHDKIRRGRKINPVGIKKVVNDYKSRSLPFIA